MYSISELYASAALLSRPDGVLILYRVYVVGMLSACSRIAEGIDHGFTSPGFDKTRLVRNALINSFRYAPPG